MAGDADPRVGIAAFHAPACDRCKGDTCAPGPMLPRAGGVPVDAQLGVAVEPESGDPPRDGTA